MTTQFTDVSAALDGRLSTLPGGFSVAWPNNDFAPSEGVLYLRPTWLPSVTVQATLGTAGEDRNDGVYQVDVFAPLGGGKKVGVDAADAVADHFKRGTALSHNTTAVRVVSASIGGARREDDRWHIPVQIRYRACMQAR